MAKKRPERDGGKTRIFVSPVINDDGTHGVALDVDADIEKPEQSEEDKDGNWPLMTHIMREYAVVTERLVILEQGAVTKEEFDELEGIVSALNTNVDRLVKEYDDRQKWISDMKGHVVKLIIGSVIAGLIAVFSRGLASG